MDNASRLPIAPEIRKIRGLIKKINNHTLPALLIVQGRGTCAFSLHHVIDRDAIRWQQFETVVDSLILNSTEMANFERYRRLSKQKRIITYMRGEDESLVVNSTETLIKAMEHYFDTFVLLANPRTEKAPTDEQAQTKTEAQVAGAEGLIFEISYEPETQGTVETPPQHQDENGDSFTGSTNEEEDHSSLGQEKDGAAHEKEAKYGHIAEQFDLATNEIQQMINDMRRQQEELPWWEYTLLKATHLVAAKKYSTVRCGVAVASSVGLLVGVLRNIRLRPNRD